MVGSMLVRGMFAGLIAGMLTLAFAFIVGEPPIERAITFEAQEARAAGEPAEPPLVSREVQRTLGLATGIGFYGVALGGLFALAFAIAQGRIGRFSPRMTAALLALGGFLVVVLVPFLKYPANPPSIGNPDTLGRRTELFLVMILLSVIAAVLSVSLGRRCAARYGDWNGALIGAGAFIALVTAVQLILPGVNEIPAQFPATVLWHFRLASLGTQLVLWTALGLLFGALTERSTRDRRPLSSR